MPQGFRPVRRAAGHQKEVVRAVDQMQKPFKQGLVVDSDHIVSEKLPDGRVSLTIHPALMSRLEAALKQLGL